MPIVESWIKIGINEGKGLSLDRFESIMGIVFVFWELF
jgi:hypothetical protein